MRKKEALMFNFDFRNLILSFSLEENSIKKIGRFFEKYSLVFLLVLLTLISVVSFFYYLSNGLGLAYNDARSHLDIGRRVIENLKPGFSQLGSVWLPLPHMLMLLTVWND